MAGAVGAGVPLRRPKRLSQALGVKVANLAQLTGVHSNAP